MGVLNLARKRCHPSAALLASKDRRGGNDYHTLSVCVGELSRAVYPKLDLAVLGRGTLGWDCGVCRVYSDGSVFRFLLDLLHKGFEREEVRSACMSYEWVVCRLMRSLPGEFPWPFLHERSFSWCGWLKEVAGLMTCMVGVGWWDWTSIPGRIDYSSASVCCTVCNMDRFCFTITFRG
jgi:hypothetical protein